MNDVPYLTSGRAERFSFDSEAYPPKERFQRYSDMNAGGPRAKEAGPHFRARLDRWRLDRALLHERWFNDVIHELDAEQAATAKLNHFMIMLVRSGRSEVDIGEGFVPIPPNCLGVVDLTRPMRLRTTDVHLTTISIARELVLATGASENDLHGLVLDRQRSALLADFLVSLVDRIDELPGDAIVAVTQAAVALLAVALDSHYIVENPDMAAENPARLNRIRRTIEQRLADPLFTADAIIEQSGLSRATVYRLFKPYGGLAAYIQKRRIDRVRVALSNLCDKRPFLQIATDAGFLSESHCSRVFQKAFGIRPGQYRADLVRANDEGALEPHLQHWEDELR